MDKILLIIPQADQPDHGHRYIVVMDEAAHERFRSSFKDLYDTCKLATRGLTPTRNVISLMKTIKAL